MAEEKRKDPADGQDYSFSELLAYYKGTYKKKELEKYWESECIPTRAKGKAKEKAKAKAKAEPKPKVKAKAKADAEKIVPVTQPHSRLPRPRDLHKEMARRDKDWRLGPVVYQVFVDRFAPSADFDKKKHLYPKEGSFHAWSELPAGGQLVESVGYYSNELAFWGGDLPSLLSKMDYIKELGVDVLYTQPVTECFSNHKYDTSDYKNVDPQYGTMQDFDALVEKVHGEGMKLVLDTVFNHCGKLCPMVQEALKEEDSPKRKWFFIGDEYKYGFKTWGGAPCLVEMRLEDKALQNYLWSGKDSVIAHWAKKGADGFRLDVASEVGLDLLSSLSRAAHRWKKGSLVIGEVWAYSPHWTSAMDGVLSLHLGVLIYGLAEGTCPGPTAAQSIMRMITDSSIEEVLKCWIVVSNHDMPRLATRLPDMQARKFAQTLQFTWPGCPLVYYGDELGLAGADDPHNRAPMPWEKNTDSNEMLKHTKFLMSLRKKHRALRIGNYRDLASDKLHAFIRTTDRVSEVIIVLANPTDQPVTEMAIIPVPAILGHTLFRDECSQDEVRLLGSTVTIQVQPKSVRIFAMVHEQGPSGDQYKRTYGHWATLDSVKPS